MIGVNNSDWLDLNGKLRSDASFDRVEIDELISVNPQTGNLEPKGTSCLILTGEDTSNGLKVTVKIHYDTTTGIYTVIPHETEEL